MMVDDLTDIGALHTFYRLTLLIVVHKDDALSPLHLEVTSGNHTDILSIRIQDREITVSLARHDLADIVEIIFLGELDDILFRHEIADRHGLVDQTGGRMCHTVS